MLQISDILTHFTPTCRVWVFIGQRQLDSTEEAWANEQLESFTSTWQTHGKAMNATGFVFAQHALVLVANEEGVKASGCSMDKINHLVKQMGTALHIDYFNRMNTLVWDNNNWQLAKFSPTENRRTVSAMTQLLGELV
ncbi:MAG: hypothetical protein ACKOWM_04645 [Sphingomonadales bacterium]